MAKNKERLDVLLVERGLCESRARARARILAGDAVVDDQRVDKAGTRVSVDAQIRLKGDGLPYVSRGGLKLAAALDAWPIPLDGAVCLDVGASTGGFTDVLLQRGAAKVFAVDVGTNQLAWKLRQDPRVVSMEKTHIAKLAEGALDPAPSVAVADVSFISLTSVLPATLPHLAARAHLFVLIKPQFEVGKERIGKGGIVRDERARQDAVDGVLACARELGLDVVGVQPSPIQGAEGNVEFVAAFARGIATADVAGAAAGRDDEGG